MASFDKQTKTQATAWMNLKAWFPAEGRHGGAQAAQLHACKALRQQRLMYSWRKPCFLLWMEGSWHGTRWTFLGIMVKLCALTGPQVCGQSHLSKLRGFRYLGFVYFLLWILQQKRNAKVLHGVCQQECIIRMNPAKTEGLECFKAKHAGPHFVPCVFNKSWTPHSNLHVAIWPGCLYLFHFIFGHVLWSHLGLFPNSPSSFQT